MSDVHHSSFLSVIMPAHNEAQRVAATIQATAATLGDTSWELIVVDDGSMDNTAQVAAGALPGDPRIQVLRLERNSGKGSALAYGFAHAQGDLIAFLDADGDLHPGQIGGLWRIMQATGAEVVIGSKRHPQSQLDYPWHRNVVSTVYFALVRVLFDLKLRDTQTGIKLFRREVLERAFPRVQVGDYAYDLELLVCAARFGYRIAEAPVTLTYQKGMGRIGLAAILRITLDTLSIFYRSSFWTWLAPSRAFKLWAVLLLLSVALGTFGAAHLLSRLQIPAAFTAAAQTAALQFIPSPWRDWMFLIGGLLLFIVALLQLNKCALSAFSTVDSGDLAGITRRRSETSKDEP